VKIYPHLGGQSNFFRPTQWRTSWLVGYARLNAANAANAANAVLAINHERVSPTALAEASIRRSPVQGSVMFTLPDSTPSPLSHVAA